MKHVAHPPKSTTVLVQFNQLMRELRDGDLRNAFQLWEFEIILDILKCNVEGSSVREILRRYQRAVQRQLARGSQLPMKLSEYLESTKHARRGKAA